MNSKRIIIITMLCMCAHISHGAGNTDNYGKEYQLNFALRRAILKNDDKQVAALLSQGADPLYKGAGGSTPLSSVVSPQIEDKESPAGKARGNYKTFKLIFDRIAPEQRTKIVDQDLVQSAFLGGNSQIITDLLATKPDTINMQNVFSLMQRFPHDQALWDIAVKAGAQIDATDSTGKTPLEAAIAAVIDESSGAEDNLKALIKAGAKVNESYTVKPKSSAQRSWKERTTQLEDVTADNLLSKVLKFADKPAIVIEENKGAGAGGAGAAGR